MNAWTKVNLPDGGGKSWRVSGLSGNPFGTLMQISVVVKNIKQKRTLNSPACFHFHETTSFILPIDGLTSLSPKWKTIIIDWSQKGNKVTRNMPKYSVCDTKVLPTCFFPQSYPKESHRNLKTVKRRVATWQRGHEKVTHTGTDSWHLTLDQPVPFVHYTSSTGPGRPQREATAPPRANRWSLFLNDHTASPCRGRETSFCHWDFPKVCVAQRLR